MDSIPTIKVLKDKFDPNVIKERLIRLQLFLQFLIEFYPNHHLVSFLTLRAVPQTFNDEAVRLTLGEVNGIERRLEEKLAKLSCFREKLHLLQRSLIMYQVCWSSSKHSWKDLKDEAENFCQLRRDFKNIRTFSCFKSAIGNAEMTLNFQKVSNHHSKLLQYLVWNHRR